MAAPAGVPSGVENSRDALLVVLHRLDAQRAAYDRQVNRMMAALAAALALLAATVGLMSLDGADGPLLGIGFAVQSAAALTIGFLVKAGHRNSRLHTMPDPPDVLEKVWESNLAFGLARAGAEAHQLNVPNVEHSSACANNALRVAALQGFVFVLFGCLGLL